MTSTQTFDSIIRLAANLPETLTDAAITAVSRALSTLDSSDARNSYARTTLIVALADAYGVTTVTDAFGIGASQVSNHRKSVKVWAATGLGEESVGIHTREGVPAWTVVTSSSRNRDKWAREDGQAMLTSVQAEGVKALATLPATVRAEATRADALVALLVRAASITDATPTDDQRAVIADALLTLAATYVAGQDVKVTRTDLVAA